MAHPKLPPFDALGSLNDSTGSIYVYWLSGGFVGRKYKLDLTIVNFEKTKGWRSSFDLDETIESNEGLEQSGGCVSHTDHGVYITAVNKDLGEYRFPPWIPPWGDSHPHAGGCRPLPPSRLGPASADLVVKLVERMQHKEGDLQEALQRVSALQAQVDKLQDKLEERDKELDTILAHPAVKGVVPMRQLSRSLSRSKGEGQGQEKKRPTQSITGGDRTSALDSQTQEVFAANVPSLPRGSALGKREAERVDKEQEPPHESEGERPAKLAKGVGKPRVVAGRGRGFRSPHKL
eukprot:jgi/Botrbrau1/9900/Bobra.0012s0003.2